MGFLDIFESNNDNKVSEIGPGKGKKQCLNCKNYTGVRKKICDCGFDFGNKELKSKIENQSKHQSEVQSNNTEVFCFIAKYSEFAKSILDNKNNLSNKNFYTDCPPGALRFSLRDCITGYSLYTKNPSEYIVIKCLRIDEFTYAGNEKLLIVEIVKIPSENVDF